VPIQPFSLDLNQLMLIIEEYFENFPRNILVVQRKALPLHSLTKNQAYET
jgi:hypothetical protein